MFGLKKEKVQKREPVNIKQITATITTLTLTEYVVTNVGFCFDGWVKQADRDLFINSRISNGLLRIDDKLDIPLTQILRITYQIDDYFIERA